MVDRKTEISDHFIHAGTGTGLVLLNLGGLIPGLFPFLALTAVVTLVLLTPSVVLGLAAVLLAAPFYLAFASFGVPGGAGAASSRRQLSGRSPSQSPVCRRSRP